MKGPQSKFHMDDFDTTGIKLKSLLSFKAKHIPNNIYNTSKIQFQITAKPKLKVKNSLEPNEVDKLYLVGKTSLPRSDKALIHLK